MIIEKLKIEDMEQVAELHKLIVPFALDLEEAKKTYAKMAENPDYLLLAAKEEGKVVGTATGICCKTLATPFLVIEDVVVSPEQRNEGVGTQLMEALEVYAKEKQCAYTILVSSGHRKEAHKFYEKLGYTDNVKGFRKIY
ncbi:MAG: GNAT family N-acetyltransferase [Lachnospiraceae bacterium]|jgi:ribosomal protein S18 acetylase RimI-like enzyme